MYNYLFSMTFAFYSITYIAILQVNALLMKWRDKQQSRATVGALRATITRHKPALRGAVYGMTVREGRS